jgi:hypothetical protein
MVICGQETPVTILSILPGKIKESACEMKWWLQGITPYAQPDLYNTGTDDLNPYIMGLPAGLLG